MMKRMAIILVRLAYFLGLSMSPSTLFANDLGGWGDTYPIAEPNLLTFIHQRLGTLQQSGELSRLEKKGQASAKAALLNPTPLPMPTAHKTLTMDYRPHDTLTHDVWLNNRLHYPAGTTIYPLDVITLHEALIFIDGRSTKQIAFAQCEAKKFSFVKIILTAGNIKNAIEKLGRVYYDQQGIVTERLHVQAVPTVVHQVGHALRIQQVDIDTLPAVCASKDRSQRREEDK